MTTSPTPVPVEPHADPAPSGTPAPGTSTVRTAAGPSPPHADAAHGARYDLFAALVLVALVAAVYGRSLAGGFVYDDSVYVSHNPDVFSDWSVQSVRWAFTTHYFSNWHPLTWLSYRIDGSLWGRRPAGFHATNVLLHAAGAVLAYLVLRRATGDRGPSLFAAALWAVHPLHVESVAWISSRKDVLSMLCAWLALGAYGAWARTGRRGWYAAALAAFAAGMMAKQTIALFPFVLLLWDVWPLKRVRWSAPPTSGGTEPDTAPPPSDVRPPTAAPAPPPIAAIDTAREASHEPSPAPLLSSFFDAAPTPRAALEARREVEQQRHDRIERPAREATAATTTDSGTLPANPAIAPRRPLALILEKLPFVAVSVVAVILAFRAQHGSGSVRTLEDFPLSVRAANAVYSYALHLRRTVWPSDLAVGYPHPRASLAGTQLALAAGLLVAVTACVVLAATRRPYLAVGWLWFLAGMLPMCGLLQLGTAGTADRYAYFPLVGIEMAVAWLAADLFRQRPIPRFVPYSAGAVVVALAAGFAFRQVGFWHDNDSLFRRALAVTRSNAPAQIEVGNQDFLRGDTERAIARFERALEIDPRSALAACNLGYVLFKLGRNDEAERQMRRALELDPTLAVAQANLGSLLENRGDRDGALRLLEEAVAHDPNLWTAQYNLARTLEERGETARAAHHYERALAIQPVNGRTRNNLARLAHASGRTDEAVRLLRQAVLDDPQLAEAHLNLGRLLMLDSATRSEGQRHLAAAAQLDPAIAELLQKMSRAPDPNAAPRP